MRRRSRPRIYDDINLTPLMDLAWTLLIVFIIMATATVQGITVNLPKASDAPSLARPQTRAITITGDGRIFLDTARVTLGELEQRLRDLRAANPDLPVVVKGDSELRYETVIQVLDLLKRLNIGNLGLVTARLVK